MRLVDNYTLILRKIQEQKLVCCYQNKFLYIGCIIQWTFMKNILLFFLTFSVASISFSQGKERVLNDSAMAIYKVDARKAIQLLENILKDATSAKNLQIISLTKNNLGIVYRDLGKFEKAKSLSSEALLKTKDSIVKASAYNNIGAANRSLGLYDEALKNYLSALSIYEALDMKEYQATVHNNIGMVYNYLGINNKAIEYHLKAKNVFEA